ncbi:hypothetical protein BJY16_007366 [Actinoplanes octamycinicus]|uniref:Uncharacterized protein n=1 Tax=Actinoplanes octamycinicus TaxID=135948 RepID=A0A7W7H4W5_9ACTN|nr:hypothetical protein [Actinoplanes octamycinicus]MBB4743907.1 hypothetical protein [Actinoplanes octamycinicus]GIE58534.1 hypothetical protein Aoc01nite_39360 [Actinoplanes octamycinicus]
MLPLVLFTEAVWTLRRCFRRVRTLLTAMERPATRRGEQPPMPTIPSHNLEQPTPASLTAALSAQLGPEAARALVDLSIKKLRLSRPYTIDDLVSLTEDLMNIGDLLRVTARSEKIRAVTYRALNLSV